ncbi:MAG TPA: response regulator transcription factor [Micromonosporaceae bacterium]
MRGSQLLAIDDEASVLSFLARALRSEGFGVTTASTGDDGIRRSQEQSYDLIVLDLVLPGTDGFAVLHQILQSRPDQSVIVLSCLSDTTSKVRCFEMGADDYLCKPFALDELLARVRARLRVRTPALPQVLATRQLTLDPVGQKVDAGSGPVALTHRECMLLAELMRNAGQMVSKERLLSAVWGYSFDPGSNVVDVTVRRLRAKLPNDVIQTVRGKGYGVDLV